MIVMACGECGEPMERQPLGQWRRTCACTSPRYWASLPPTPADAATFRQLTGRTLVPFVLDEDASGTGWLYQYGPR